MLPVTSSALVTMAKISSPLATIKSSDRGPSLPLALPVLHQDLPMAHFPGAARLYLRARPSPDQSKLAIGGFGLKQGTVAVIDRESGKVEHILEKPITGQVTRDLQFSPSGKYVVYGTDSGELFRWDYARGDKGLVRLQKSKSGQINRVRLLRFLDKNTFLCLPRTGRFGMDLLSMSAKPRRTFTTGTTSIFRGP